MLLDWLVVLVYLVGVTLVGVWSAKKVRTASNFFISDRKFGKIMMTFFTFGTGTNTDQAVTVAAKTYQSGASGIWYQWLWLFSTPFYWLLSPLFRRMRAVTTADYLFKRYGSSVAVLFALVGMAQLSVSIGVILKASSAVITAVTGGAISPGLAIIGMTVLFVIYGVAGGLNAAIITDFFQGILTVMFSFLILPFALQAVGGLGGLKALVNNPALFEIVTPSEITTLYVVIIALNALIGWVTAPYSMAMCGAGKTEQEARIGLVSGMLLKRICTIAWVLTGLCGIGLYLGKTIHIDHVYGLMAHDLLPTIAPGLVGLFIASMLAAVMSSCDCFMVSSAALFTENIYKPLIKPDRDEKHYILIGRITSVAVVAFGIIFAFRFTSVVQGLEIFWRVQAMMGIAIWVSFFWRKATAAAAWASTLGSFAVWFFTSKIDLIGWDFNAHFARFLPEFMLYESQLSLPWQMIFYLTFGLAVMVGVSLFTKPQDKEILDRVYECIRTPVGPNEPEVEPLTLPENTKPAPRNVLINHPDFEITKPSLSSVLGFLATWVAVGLLIAAFVWILR
ncbi:MAG: sodium:solute symporter family protein [Candidatus Aminicenantes bacterium]|nr:MAG: sodium:solute symporter family protein [Candidatus Aminicenantes bacterium]